MLVWWTCAIGIGTALALAATLAERLAWERRLPSRWPWLLALVGSAAWPLLAAAVRPAASPAAGGAAAAQHVLASVVPASAAGALHAAFAGVASSADVWLPRVWIALSASLVAAGVVTEAGLRAMCRRCPQVRIAGVRVWLSLATGPAVFGVWTPRILMPSWIASLTPRQRRLALLHELDHARAGDPRLLWCGYLAVCAMPWNPASWWLYGRLQRAVELDCDARLAGRLANVHQYGVLLARAASWRQAWLPPAPALRGRRTLLRHRIERLAAARRPPRAASWALAMPMLACLALALAVPVPAIEAPQRVVRDPGIRTEGAAWIHALQEETVQGGFGSVRRAAANGTEARGGAPRRSQGRQSGGVLRPRGTYSSTDTQTGAPARPGSHGVATITDLPPAAGGAGPAPAAGGPGGDEEPKPPPGMPGGR